MIKEEKQSTLEKAESTSKKDINPVFRKDVIIKGTMWFALITIISIAIIFFYNNTGNTIHAVKRIKPFYIFLCFIMLFADLMLGSWRNHIFIKKLNPSVPQWVSFKANVANMFMGAVTPVHSGAAPAQIYVYVSNGVSFLDAFVVSLMNLGATLTFMPLAGLLAVLVMNDNYETGIITSLIQYGFGFFTIFLVAFILAFWKPTLAGAAIQKLAKLLSRIFPYKQEKLAGCALKSYNNIAKYQERCKVILKKHPHLFPLALLITTVLYLNKYCLQYVILVGLGVDVSLINVILIQILIQFMIYFAPSPGGSGFAEISISILFGKIVPEAILPIFTLLQRSFLLFFPAVVGAYFVIGLLKKQAGKPVPEVR